MPQSIQTRLGRGFVRSISMQTLASAGQSSSGILNHNRLAERIRDRKKVYVYERNRWEAQEERTKTVEWDSLHQA